MNENRQSYKFNFCKVKKIDININKLFLNFNYLVLLTYNKKNFYSLSTMLFEISTNLLILYTHYMIFLRYLSYLCIYISSKDDPNSG